MLFERAPFAGLHLLELSGLLASESCHQQERITRCCKLARRTSADGSRKNHDDSGKYTWG